MRKTIVMTGGGTAGHVMPNLALLPYLREEFCEFHYIGSQNGVEKKIIQGYPFIKYHEITTVKLVRSLTLSNFRIPFMLMRAINESGKALLNIKPDVIFSKGGYVALPVIKAAKNIPIICHESDLTMGLANKLSIKKCDIVCTSFDSTAKYLKNGVYTGAPIRNRLYNGKRLDLIFTQNLPILLIMGGSLGAKAINACVRAALPTLQSHYNIIHICGKGNLEQGVSNHNRVIGCEAGKADICSQSMSQRNGKADTCDQFTRLSTSRIAPHNQTKLGRYYCFEFSENIEDFLYTADFVISRGGAGSLFELLTLRKPSLIIPLPKGGSRGDQIQNAEYLQSKGCCHVIKQENLTVDSLLNGLYTLKNDSDLIKNIDRIPKIDGTKTIAEIIISVANNNRL